MAGKRRLVTRTPQTWLGTLAEAAFGTAGRSIAIGDRWYRFKRGKGLVASDARLILGRTELCVVEDGEGDDAELRKLIGRRWSPLFNCATAFAPFWRSGMSNISTGDRQSIARTVILGVVVVAVAILGGGWLLNEWIDAKFERQARSMNAHFGQIKSMLRD